MLSGEYIALPCAPKKSECIFILFAIILGITTVDFLTSPLLILRAKLPRLNKRGALAGIGIILYVALFIYVFSLDEEAISGVAILAGRGDIQLGIVSIALGIICLAFSFIVAEFHGAISFILRILTLVLSMLVACVQS